MYGYKISTVDINRKDFNGDASRCAVNRLYNDLNRPRILLSLGVTMTTATTHPFLFLAALTAGDGARSVQQGADGVGFCLVERTTKLEPQSSSHFHSRPSRRDGKAVSLFVCLSKL